MGKRPSWWRTNGAGNTVINRPPVGFIVEGDGEYNCYPSLFCRIVNVNGINVPIVNAGGCGSIVKRIKEQLTDLFLIDSPLNVVVTVDLDDVLRQRLATTCVDLLERLNSQIEEWLARAETDDRLHPLPKKIICIVQIRKFESWLISDVEGLKSKNLVKSDICDISDSQCITGPGRWLTKNLLIDGCSKSPTVAKKLISAQSPERMRLHNRSFDKFYREITTFYNDWMDDISQS